MSKHRRILLASAIAAMCVAFATLGEAQSPAPAEQTSQPQPPAPSIQKQDVKSYKLSPEKYEKAVAYSRTQYALHFIGAGYSLVLLLIIIALRVAPKCRDWVERVSQRRFVQAIIFVPLLLLTFDVLKLPLDVYQHHLAVR
jgi:hypothetical protein